MQVITRRTVRGFVLSAIVMSLFSIVVQSSFGQTQRALLTVDGLNIPAGGALAAFHIDTWGVTPLAVCKIPRLWEMKAETYLDSAATLSGRSDQNHRMISEVDQVFLVDVDNYQPLPSGDLKTVYHPASFSGWYTVFDGNGNVLKRRRSFHANNFHLSSALRCPDAPPAQP